MSTNATTKLPNGNDFWLALDITENQATGILVLVITSVVSALAVLTLLTSIALSAWNTRKSVNPHMFVRSHAAAYLVSLLICDFCQAIGSLMNARWYMQRSVHFEPFCEAQGVMKQLSDIGTAIWALVIAVHTFWVLFLRWDLRRIVMIAAIICSWSSIGAFVIAGPAALDVKRNGPFFAISGYWCWISDQYPIARIALDYMFMFASAFLSFVLYTLIYLKLRGNLIVTGWRVRFRLHRDTDSANGLAADSQAIKIAKQMLLYPVAYTIIILPIALCRFADWSGHEVSFTVTIFSDCIYLMSGLINVLLFFFTRRVLPRHSVITKRFSAESEEDADFDFVDEAQEAPRSASFMAEKMTLEADANSSMAVRPANPWPTPGPRMDSRFSQDDASDTNSIDEKMFKDVDSPDGDDKSEGSPESEFDSDSEVPVVVPVVTKRPPSLPPVAPLNLSPRKAGRLDTPRQSLSGGGGAGSDSALSRVSLDSSRYSLSGNTSARDRTQFPASATGQLQYPQSPLTRESFGGRAQPPRSASAFGKF